MIIDELIHESETELESLRSKYYKLERRNPYLPALDTRLIIDIEMQIKLHEIALACLKAYKQGLRMCELDPETKDKDGDMDWVKVQTELDEILGGLE